MLSSSPTLVTPNIGAATGNSLSVSGNVNGATLAITGSSSGVISIASQAAAGTYNFNLPIIAGTSGQILTSAGGGAAAMTWTTPITSIGLSVPSFLSVSGSPLTANGSLAVTLSGTALAVANGGTGSTSSTGSGSVVLQTSPTLITPIIGVASGTSLGLSSQLTSTVSSGTAPFVVSSSTIVNNLNANYLEGATFSSPSIIGSSTPNSAAFTSVTITSSLTNTLGTTTLSSLLATTGSFTSTVNMNLNQINSVAAPSLSDDVATKGYVDSLTQGSIIFKASVVAATTVPGTLASSFASGNIIDSITLTTGDRILIQNQTNQVENGVYDVNVSGSPTRSSDFSTGTNVAGVGVYVISGTINGGSAFVCISNTGSDIIDTDPTVFTQFSSPSSITAGTGLTKAGNVLSVNTTQTQIVSVGTLIDLNVTGLGTFGSISSGAGTYTGVLTVTTETNSGTLKVLGSGSGTQSTTAGGLFTVLSTTTNDSGTISSGTLSNWYQTYFGQPTLSATNSSVTTTEASTVYIDGPVLAGTNETIGTSYSLFVKTGSALFGGSILLKGSSSGIISIKSQVAAGTYAFNLPITAGTSGQVLTSAAGGASPMTWTTLTTGTVTSISVSVPSFLSISGSPITSSGTFGISLSGTALPIVNGGTGSTTATGSGSVVLANTPTLITPILGVATGTSLSVSGNVNGGTLAVTGSTSGVISIAPQAAAGTYNFNLPTTAGTAGQRLVSGGGGSAPMTWATPTIGTVTSVAMTVPTHLSITGSPITSSGTLALTFSGTALPVINGGTGSTTATGSGSVVLAMSPTLISPVLGAATGTSISVTGNINSSTLTVTGSSSGVISIVPQAIAGTYNFNLPVSAGTSGQVLTSAAGGANVMTWTTLTTGTVTSVALTVPSFLSVSGSPITSSGTLSVTLSGTALPILNGGTGSTTATGSGSVVLSTSPTLITPTLGVATGTSLSVSGNVNGGSHSICGAS